MVGLDRLLAALDVTVASFAVCDVGAGQHSDPSGAGGLAALYVLSGSGRIRVPGAAAVEVAADTFVVLPHGLDHRIELDATDSGAASPGLVAVCGALRATFGGGAGLFGAAKAPILASFADRPMRDSFLTLADELSAPAVGTRALTESIVKQALILLLRRQSAADPAAPPWIAALRDARLAPALAAMLDRPADPLSLEALARLAGMSRSTFAGRFGAAFGQPPIEFLKDLRLGRAARLLATTDLPVKTVASAVGYESRSYFSRAFRARYAIDPTDYRVAHA